MDNLGRRDIQAVIGVRISAGCTHQMRGEKLRGRMSHTGNSFLIH